jgi:hypothetical protein
MKKMVLSLVSVWLLLCACTRQPAAEDMNPSEVVSEPWRSIIDDVKKQTIDKTLEMMPATSPKAYTDLRAEAAAATKSGDLNKLYWTGTQLAVMGKMGRTEAYGDAITIFLLCLRKNPSFAPAKSGLASAYFDLTLRTLTPAKDQSGLYIFPLDKRGAQLMTEVYRLAKAAAQEGSGDPEVLAMSLDELAAYLRGVVRDGDLSEIRTLLTDTPDLVFTKDSRYGLTPLHIAASWGRRDVAELLLAKKAEVSAKDNDGLMPFHTAVLRGHRDVAELLLASGAELNARDNHGNTSLAWAVHQGDQDMAEWLRQQGARE